MDRILDEQQGEADEGLNARMNEHLSSRLVNG